MGKQRICRDHFRFYTLLICYANDAQQCQSQLEAALRTTVLYILNKSFALIRSRLMEKYTKVANYFQVLPTEIIFYDLHNSTFRHCQVIIAHPF